MNRIQQVLAVTAFALGGAAHASVVLFETASSGAGAQNSAAAYRDVVNAAFATPGSHAATVAQFDGLSSQALFGGSTQNIAFRSTIDFGVNASQAGLWSLRAGVDFGNGGAVFLDGVALGYKSNDMWWSGSYGNTAGTFDFSSLAIGSGNHELQLFGLENCCDGGQQAQFSVKGASFVTFGANDGLSAALPEPGSWALLITALTAATGATLRRKRTGNAA